MTTGSRARGVAAMIGLAFDTLEKSIVVVCFFGISVLIFSGVLSRFVFAYSIAWTEEMVRFLFMWGALFGASAAFHTNAHGGLSILVDRFPPHLQRLWARVLVLVIFLFLVFLAWQSYGNTLRAFRTQQMSMTTGIPVWVVNGGVTLAFVFGAIRNLQALVSRNPHVTANESG